MRTNIVIDEKLMAKAMKATGMSTKRQTVEAALKLAVRLHAQRQLLDLSGKAEWVGDLEKMRLDQ